MEELVQSMSNAKRIALAYLLYVLVGFFGGHRWFLGRYRSAMAMTIACASSMVMGDNGHGIVAGIIMTPLALTMMFDLIYTAFMAMDFPGDAYSFSFEIPSFGSTNATIIENVSLRTALQTAHTALATSKQNLADMKSEFDDEYDALSDRLAKAEAQRDAYAKRLVPIFELDREVADIKDRIQSLRTDSLRAAEERINAVERQRIELEAQLGPMVLFAQRKAGLEAGLLTIRTVDIPAAQRDLEALRATYAQKRTVLDLLHNEISQVQERVSLTELGIYEPQFDLADSAAYRTAIEKVRAEMKASISSDRAVACNKAWTVGKSEQEGQRMIARQKKLTLRAFNGEADVAIAKVRWNNFEVMEARIRRSQEAINKVNESLEIVILSTYVRLKLKELRLVYEHREKQREEREALKEEQRAQREEDELHRRAVEAEREEARYQRLLDKAKIEAARGDDSEALRSRILELEQNIASAAAESERARAMAELTKCGYVYVISNAGSFGDDVVKIGLTRRLEPEDRIRELSGASVPFSFDIHAMIYSDRAPDLEHALHREFDAVRVNAANPRKEFFRCDLDRIEAAVRRVAPDAHFTRDVAGDEWRRTVEFRTKRLEQTTAPVELSALPQTI